MALLRDKTITLFNLHSALWSFGNKTITIFGPIYMLQLGVSLPVVALIWGLSYVGRFLLRPLSLVLVQKIGLKKSLIIGTVVYAGILPAIYQVQGIGWWMWFLVLYLAVSDILYFLPYHALYAGIGDHADRGKQLAARGILQLLFATAAPIVGSILAATFGFKATYIGGVLALIAAAVPLCFIPDFTSNLTMGLRQAYRSIDFRGFWIMLGDGFKVQVEGFVWVVTIFFLANNLINFGWLVALETFLVTILLVVLGRLIDGGKGKKIFLLGSVGLCIMFLVRAFFVINVTGIIVAQVALAIVLVFYELPFDAVLYNMAKRTKSTLWFHFFGEAGSDVSNGVVFFLTALLVYRGIKVQYILPLGVLSIIIIKPILDSYFQSNRNNLL
jgi:hypothetical protein